MSDVSRLPELPVAELRPGVLRPDWSVVTLPKARDTLRRRLSARPEGVARWAALGPDSDQAWQTILRLFAGLGRAPDSSEVARATNRSPEEVRQALKVLRERDLVVLDESGTAVLAAYPFTSYRTGQQVTIDSRTLHALCAIDALGAGAMCDADSTIIADCPCCRTPIRVETRGNGRQLRTVAPGGTVVWYTLVFDGCAAQSCCPSTLFFCDEMHLRRWLDVGGSGLDGECLTIEEGFEIGTALFGTILRETV